MAKVLDKVKARGGPVVPTTAGPVLGALVKGGTMARFRGIPYAAPPVGDRRWAPPRLRDAERASLPRRQLSGDHRTR